MRRLLTISRAAPAALIFVLLACDQPRASSSSAFGEAEERIRPQIPATLASTRRFARLNSCVEGPRWEATIEEVVGVAPEDMGRKKPQDAGWIPARVTDLFADSTVVAVLDGGASEVSLFEPSLLRRRTWGRRGPGPSELSDPRAIAVDGAGHVWILDASPWRVAEFTPSGRLVHSFPIEGPASDIAIGLNQVILAHDIVPNRAEANPDRYGRIVSRYRTTGERIEDLLTFRSVRLPEQRLVLPGPNPVRVDARGGAIAVLYPAAGVVDFFTGETYASTAAACMPKRLRTLYKDQYENQEAHANSAGQAWVPLAIDVSSADERRASLIGFMKTKDDRFHVDHFARGELQGSTIMPGKGMRLPPELRFGGSDSVFYGFDPTGVIIKFQILPGD